MEINGGRERKADEPSGKEEPHLQSLKIFSKTVTEILWHSGDSLHNLSSSKQLGAWRGIVWNVAEGWLCLNSWRIWNIFLSVGVPMVVSHAISLIRNLWRYLYFGYTLLYFLGGGYVLYYGGKMEQDSGAFPEQTTSPISSSFPLLIKELLPKNKFNHRNEKMQKWRKTAKQDKIIIV